MFTLCIVLVQRIEARVKRAMNVGDCEANDVDGDANSGSNDDDDGYPPPPPSSSSPPTVSKTVSKKRKHHAAPTAGAIEEGSLCIATLPDSYARPRLWLHSYAGAWSCPLSRTISRYERHAHTGARDPANKNNCRALSIMMMLLK